MSLARVLNELLRDDDPYLYGTSDPFSIVPHTHYHRPGGRRQQSQSDQQRVQRRGGSGLSELANFEEVRTPRVQVLEEENKFVVSAEVPGIRKEELDVHIGDGGRSLRIQGRSGTHVTSGQGQEAAVEGTQQGGKQEAAVEGAKQGGPSTSADVAKKPEGEVGRPQYRGWSSYSFSRTIWLPRAVNPAGVKANLDHGVLTLDIPKQEEPGNQKIDIQ